MISITENPSKEKVGLKKCSSHNTVMQIKKKKKKFNQQLKRIK